jgi:peptide/nickel transport system substrate-binding protein
MKEEEFMRFKETIGRCLKTLPSLLVLTTVLMLATMSLAQTTYNEAPSLAERVAAGELPPVEERLPENPLIVDVVEEIGQYGGVWRRAFLGPADANNYVRVVYDSLLRFSPDGSEIMPHLVESWEPSEDFTSWTLHLRRGARWSDGEPFTADAIMFWYEDVVLNEDLTPTVPSWIQNADGSPVLVEREDDDSVRFTFDQPDTLFLTELTFRDGGDRTLAAFLPGHYLRQFHPNHADEAELQAMVRGAGFETWTELFMTRAMPTENPERPTMAAWVPYNSTVSDQTFVLRRNPYYIGVDPEGNQLPYVDEVHFRFFSDVEALNFAAVTGEFDFQARHVQMTNYPVLIENEERGGYRVITWPTARP